MANVTNKLKFEVLQGWEQLPDGWSFVEVAGVATDSQDRVYAFNRGDHPMIVFEPDGTFVTSWGEGVFTNAHGLCIGPDDVLYCADNHDHTVRIYTPQGELIRTLGRENEPSDTGFVPGRQPVQRGGGPFNMVTNVAVATTGDLYVSDGYGNARVHVFSGDGNYRFSWGEPGSGPGEFILPHAIALDRNDRVYVADRENSRIQVFDAAGAYLTEFGNISRPDDLFIDIDENLYVAELGERAGIDPRIDVPPHAPHARVSIMTLDGTIHTQFGGEDPVQPGNFFAPHGIWADSRGDLYVAEVIYSGGGQHGLVPLDTRSLQKFVRVRGQGAR